MTDIIRRPDTERPGSPLARLLCLVLAVFALTYSPLGAGQSTRPLQLVESEPSGIWSSEAPARYSVQERVAGAVVGNTASIRKTAVSGGDKAILAATGAVLIAPSLGETLALCALSQVVGKPTYSRYARGPPAFA